MIEIRAYRWKFLTMKKSENMKTCAIFALLIRIFLYSRKAWKENDYTALNENDNDGDGFFKKLFDY